MPKRIQRRRTKGWTSPAGVIYCGRPTKFGNPYTADAFGRYALELFADTASGIWVPYLWMDRLGAIATRKAYGLHQKWLKRIGGHPLEMIRAELRGRDLSCWCSLAERCHVDELLRLANQ